MRLPRTCDTCGIRMWLDLPLSLAFILLYILFVRLAFVLIARRVGSCLHNVTCSVYSVIEQHYVCAFRPLSLHEHEEKSTEVLSSVTVPVKQRAAPQSHTGPSTPARRRKPGHHRTQSATENSFATPRNGRGKTSKSPGRKTRRAQSKSRTGKKKRSQSKPRRSRGSSPSGDRRGRKFSDSSIHSASAYSAARSNDGFTSPRQPDPPMQPAAPPVRLLCVVISSTTCIVPTAFAGPVLTCISVAFFHA